MVGSAAADRFNPTPSLRDGKLTYILRSPEKRHRFGVTALALSPSGDTIYTAGRDGTVREWGALPKSTSTPPARPRFGSGNNSNIDARCGVSDGAVKTFEEHVDWVNDLVLLQGGDRLVSCSSDTTVKVWNARNPAKSLRTLRQHSDYVKALACVPSNRVASASLDGRVLIWDLTTGSVHMQCGHDLSENANGNSSNANGNNSGNNKSAPSSVYCLSGSASNQTLVAGSTDRSISVYDLRTGERIVRLRGHSDSVRCCVLKHDGTQMLSGSTDSTVKLWDLRQERCIQSYDPYTSIPQDCTDTTADSVWALAADRNFDEFVSGSRDGTVWHFDTRSEVASNVVEQVDPDPRSNMVLDIMPTHDMKGVWVSTTGSDVKLWPLHPSSTTANGTNTNRNTRERRGGHESTPTPAPTASTKNRPYHHLKGLPGIISYKIMNDRRHVITCDAYKECSIWDITQGKFEKSLGKLDNEDFEQYAKEHDREVSVPSWFTVDIRLGSLAIHMVKKYVFSAEIYAVDAGLTCDSEETKVNIGEHVVRGLFAKWFKKYKELFEDSDDDTSNNNDDEHGAENGTYANGNGNKADDGTQQARRGDFPPYEFPESVQVIVTDTTSPVPVLLKRVGSFDGNEERTMPTWVVDLVRDNRAPARTVEKMAFSLQPAEGSELPPLSTTALNAPRVLRARKVASYIAEHLPEEFQANDTANIEILCNGVVIGSDMSLATIHHFKWKSPEDLKLKYRRKAT